MRKASFWMAVAMVVAIAGSGAFAATSFWLTTNPGGAPSGPVDVQAGGSLTLYCYMNAGDIGNTFEMMVGYDTSDASTYGAGKDTNNGAAKKLTLASTQGQIVSNIDSFFDLCTNPNPPYNELAVYANSQVVLDASGREVSNPDLGGRPYGFVTRSARIAQGPAPGEKKLFSFALQADSGAAGQSQNVVVSNYTGGNSYSSAWKNGISLYEDSDTLLVNITSPGGGPTVGITNKAVLDTLVGDVAADYTWVLWGKITVTGPNTFTLDDGSGVTITVNATAHGYTSANDGKYVSVKGALSNIDTNAKTATLTSQAITEYN